MSSMTDVDFRIVQHFIGVIGQKSERQGDATVGGKIEIGNPFQRDTCPQLLLQKACVLRHELDNTGSDGAEPYNSQLDLLHNTSQTIVENARLVAPRSSGATGALLLIRQGIADFVQDAVDKRRRFLCTVFLGDLYGFIDGNDLGDVLTMEKFEGGDAEDIDIDPPIRDSAQFFDCSSILLSSCSRLP